VNGIKLVLEEKWLVCIVEHCREGYIYGKAKRGRRVNGYI
jgi:hypothetical protein